MDRMFPRRRSPPAVIWAFLVILILAVVALLVTAQLIWQRTKQVQVLQGELEILQTERQTTDAQLAALQGTATAMENRLAVLEANDPAQQIATLQAAVENAGDSQEVSRLHTSLTEIQTTVNRFQTTLDQLAARLEALEPASDETGQTLPPEAKITVARQRQTHNLSCESSASSMVAGYHNVPLSEADVLNALPLHDNPNLGFRGNVDGPTGGIEDYGVYAAPIQAILNARGLQAWPVEGGLDGIKAAIARGNPVIVWVTYNCLPSTPTKTTIEGREVILVPNQHVVVVTGYNAEGVWANDPWDGQEDFYPYADLLRAMSYFVDPASSKVTASSKVMAIEVAAP